MNHEAEVCMQGDAKTEGNIGVHMSVSVKVVVPTTMTFGAPPRAKEMKVDASKVIVNKRG
jgi:hypothetical protein